MEKINARALSTSLLISLGTGILAAILTSDSMQQYENMYQPPLSPPGWLFPIVWTILYILMGIAAYRIYIEENASDQEKKNALKSYGIQLVLNFIWPILFFRFQLYYLAFAWLLLLWYFIFETRKAFQKIDKTAGDLLLPYLLWVTFAGYLNLMIALFS